MEKKKSEKVLVKNNSKSLDSCNKLGKTGFSDNKNTPSPEKEVCVYARVSTNSQDMEQQVLACERFCRYRNFKILRVYEDVGSGKTYRDRPSFVLMLNDVRTYKYDGVVVFRLDRLFRNVVEAVNIIQELDVKGIEIYSITENLDTSSPIGRAMRDIILVLAKLERENISEATKARLQALKDQGVKLGRPSISPFQVNRISTLRQKGKSYREIAENMNIKKSTVAKYCKELGLGSRNV